MQETENFNIHIEKCSEDNSYCAYLKDDYGTALAENRFYYRIDTHILSRLEDSVGREVPENATFIKEFGSELFKAVFAKGILDLYESRLREGSFLRIRLVFKKENPNFLRIPWEFLYDGNFFLSAYSHMSLSRTLEGYKNQGKDNIKGKIKMLAVVSSPLDLKDNERLQIENEKEYILRSMDRAIASYRVEVDFEEEASLRNIQARLDEKEYNILHYTGHGSYEEGIDRGYLLLEDDAGRSKPVDNDTAAELFSGYPSLRLVVLSGCQTAKTSGRKALSDLSTPLIVRGIPAVLSMQYSVTDDSAINMAAKFYKGIADGRPLDRAITDARKELLLHKEAGCVDFATPVLFATDYDCLAVDSFESKTDGQKPRIKTKIVVNLEQLGERFIGRRRELRKIKEDFLIRGVRTIILHGFGGIGKTVLATRAIDKLLKDELFDYVYSFDCRGGLEIEKILFDLSEFLSHNGLNIFVDLVKSDKPLDLKLNYVGQGLSKIRLLVILDNFESLLKEEKKNWEIAKEEMKKGLKILINQCPEGTKFIFTSRFTFDLMEGRLTNFIDEINLAELPRTEAIMVMNRFPEIAVEDFETKLKIFEKIGGHPYTINIFGRHARRKSVKMVLDDIAEVNKEMVEFTLLKKTCESLTEKAQLLLNRGAVFNKAVPFSGLKWMVRDAAMSMIEDELEELIHWGLIVSIEEEDEPFYQVHTVVKDYIKGRTELGVWRQWLIMGGEFYEDQANMVPD